MCMPMAPFSRPSDSRPLRVIACTELMSRTALSIMCSSHARWHVSLRNSAVHALSLRQHSSKVARAAARDSALAAIAVSDDENATCDGSRFSSALPLPVVSSTSP
jgi:hypothetical protein